MRPTGNEPQADAGALSDVDDPTPGTALAGGTWHRPFSRRALAAWALAGLMTFAAGCGERGPGPWAGAPVILISVDTLRADRLPAYGYTGVATPALDQLRRESVLFSRAYSHYPLTLPSHSSLLSGLLPTRHGVRDNMGYLFDGAKVRSLAALFASSGYATGGFVSSFVLRRETGISAGFAHYDSEIALEAGASLDSAQRAGLDSVARAAAWVRGQGDRPYFLFLHLYEPHAPYSPPEPFASQYAAEPYDGEVATVDLVLGGLFAELRRLGHWDRAIVALVSDHGEGLGDHGEAQHGVFLYAATLHVPLLVKLPGGERGGQTAEQLAGLIDVYPTLASLAGLAVPPGLDGHPLLAAPAVEAAALADERAIYAESFYPRLHYGWSDLQALIDRRYWYIEAPEPELYDQTKDPAQTTNILRDERRAYAERRDRLSALQVPLAAPAAVDEETANKLAALGYLSGSVRTAGPLPDPKSQRHLLAEMQDGWRKFAAQDYAGAAVHFRTLVTANPQMLDIWGFLGRSLKHLGQTPESVAAFQQALELSGGDPQLALAVASGQLELGQLDEARRHAELALAANPQSAQELLARIEVAAGQGDLALERIAAAAAAGHASEPMLRRLARARIEQGNPRGVVELLGPYATAGEPATLALLGLAFAELGRLGEAEELLRRSLAADAQAARAHEGLGIVLLRQGRAAEARSALERALALDAKLPDAWNSLGVALYGLAGPREAIAAWQRAVTLDGNQLDALFNLGMVAADIGERGLARDSLRRFVRDAKGPGRAADRAKAEAVLRELAG